MPLTKQEPFCCKLKGGLSWWNLGLFNYIYLPAFVIQVNYACCEPMRLSFSRVCDYHINHFSYQIWEKVSVGEHCISITYCVHKWIEWPSVLSNMCNPVSARLSMFKQNKYHMTTKVNVLYCKKNAERTTVHRTHICRSVHTHDQSWAYVTR